jgi:hypothetical protein
MSLKFFVFKNWRGQVLQKEIMSNLFLWLSLLLAFFLNRISALDTHQMRIQDGIKGGLAIGAMPHWSQEPLQSPIQNVKKGPFGGI